MRGLGPVLLLSLLLAAPARAEQPMDRLLRLIETGKGAEAEELARRWLEKNAADRRVAEVVTLLSEAAWLVVGANATVGTLQAFRAEFPQSTHGEEARLLESNLSYFLAKKVGTEAAFLAVMDSYPRTPAARDAGEQAAKAAFASVSAGGSSEALSGYLSRYPDGADGATVRDLLMARLWIDAEASDTVEAWLALRAAFPDHPRAVDAREREASAAVRALGPSPAAAPLLSVGARYEQTASGATAVQKGLAQSELVLVRRGRTPLRRDALGTHPGFEVERHPLGAAIDRVSPLEGAGLVAFGLHLTEPLPRRLVLSWAVQGEALPTLAGTAIGIQGLAALAAWPGEGPRALEFGVSAGAEAQGGEASIALRAAGFETLKVELRFLSGPAQIHRPPPPFPGACAAGVGPPIGAALLLPWSTCGEGLSAVDGARLLLATAEQLQALGAPLAPGGLVVQPGCPHPVRSPLPLPPTGTDSVVAPSDPAELAPAGQGIAPQVPPWIGLPIPSASAARDLDGDGAAEGLHLFAIAGDTLLVVVDGATPPAPTTLLAVPSASRPEVLFASALHDGCAVDVDSAAVPEWRNR